MIRFYDGPAKNELLGLRQSPDFLRVVHSRSKGWDGLDQAGDSPRHDEQVYAYARVDDARWFHIKACGKGKAEIGGFWPEANYKLVEPQPDEGTLRDNDAWSAWCVAQARPSAPAPEPEPDAPAEAAGPRTLIVDGDAIAWRAAFYARTGADAGQGARRTVEKIYRDLQGERAIVCLSDPSRRYFRHELFGGYKARSKERPPAVDAALAALRELPGHKSLPGLEADDVVGILATCPTLQGERIIVADDKDLLTVPGRHCRNGKLFDVSVAEAGLRHLIQTLVGDSGDGYPGCPGIGPKKAEQVVTLDAYRASPAGAWRAVVATFEQRGLTYEDALLQARLARICRSEDYDLDARRVIPWEPPVDEAAERTVAHVA